MDNHETPCPLDCGPALCEHPGDCPDQLRADGTPVPGTSVAVPEPTDPSGTPLREVSTAALAFALGYTATQPVRADRWGGVCAMVEELQSRMLSRPGNGLPITAWAALLESLPIEVAKQLSMLYSMQRAQRWSQTGRRQ